MPKRRYCRTPYLIDCKGLSGESPRDAGQGEPLDLAQVMDIN